MVCMCGLTDSTYWYSWMIEVMITYYEYIVDCTDDDDVIIIFIENPMYIEIIIGLYNNNIHLQ